MTGLPFCSARGRATFYDRSPAITAPRENTVLFTP